MNRRGFLGSVLGTLVISKIPFLADPLYDALVNQEIIYKKQNLIYMTSQEIIQNVEGIIHAGFDQIYPIHSPEIKSIKREIFNNIATFSFQMEDVHSTQSFLTRGAGLLWKDSREYIGSSNFTGGSQALNNGDILKCTYGLSIHDLSEKELQVFWDNK